MTHHFQTTVQRVFRLDLSMLRHQLHAANSAKFSNQDECRVQHSTTSKLILFRMEQLDPARPAELRPQCRQ